jgi:hypothetical protein
MKMSRAEQKPPEYCNEQIKDAAYYNVKRAQRASEDASAINQQVYGIPKEYNSRIDESILKHTKCPSE